MQVDAGELIGKLRDRLALAWGEDEQVMASFDRAALSAILEEHQEVKETPQQRGARTRAANRQKKQRMEDNSAAPAPKGPVAVPANGAPVEGGQ